MEITDGRTGSWFSREISRRSGRDRRVSGRSAPTTVGKRVQEIGLRGVGRAEFNLVGPKTIHVPRPDTGPHCLISGLNTLERAPNENAFRIAYLAEIDAITNAGGLGGCVHETPVRVDPEKIPNFHDEKRNPGFRQKEKASPPVKRATPAGTVTAVDPPRLLEHNPEY